MGLHPGLADLDCDGDVGPLDVDCDDDTDVLDVIKFNQVVNQGADPDTLFCDPCAP
jgi:hypothetical protein